MPYKEITQIEQIPEAINEMMRMLATIQANMLNKPVVEAPVSPRDNLLTRKEACSILKISLVTLGEMSKRGDIKAYRLKNVRGVRYKKSEIESALSAFKTA